MCGSEGEASFRHQDAAPSLAEKVAFLRSPAAYGPVGEVACRETHMSFVFLAGDRAFKLKKPVRFPYLDFSTLARREAACRAEIALNRRLAGDVYLGVVPLVQSERGLALGADGAGEVVDWLVMMRRLDEAATLEHAIRERRLAICQLDEVIAALVAFYRRARPVAIAPRVHLAAWRQSLAYNRRVLLDPGLDVPAGLARRVDRAQRLFLARRSGELAGRARRIVDGHGDLRPEHIWLGAPVRIIDCLEFNAALRAVDPLDEIAFLSLECERLGAVWAAERLKRRLALALHARGAEALFAFYRCHRATLRARLAIAHLLEAHPREPEKWPLLARTYLRLALVDAQRLERGL
jgi:aminoglycoside phosphotransferase family enzyme